MIDYHRLKWGDFMFIYIPRFKLKLIVMLGVLLIIAGGIMFINDKHDDKVMVVGAFLHSNTLIDNNEKITDLVDLGYALQEQFMRPSKLPAIELDDYYLYSKEKKAVAIGDTNTYQSPEKVVKAYYAILREASMMIGYCGGCGTILGSSNLPHAYKLFSEETREDMSLKKYESSFAGTGGTALLHLIPAFQLMTVPKNERHFFVEVEVLKGYPRTACKEGSKPNYFEYYYGLVTTIYQKDMGWKIKSIDYIPETYLCHPLHGWSYNYKFFLGVIYNNWYHMELKFDDANIENNIIEVIGKNNHHEYRFEFARLTNGTDVLLHEYIKEGDVWVETTLLKPDVLSNKISTLTFEKNRQGRLTMKVNKY